MRSSLSARGELNYLQKFGSLIPRAVVFLTCHIPGHVGSALRAIHLPA